MTICYVNSLAIYNFNDDKTRQNKFCLHDDIGY